MDKNTRFFFVGNNLSLDFINTEIAVGGTPQDLLTDFEAFITWTAAAGLVDGACAEAFARDWGATLRAAKFIERTRAFRGVLRGIVLNLENGKEVEQSSLDIINSLLHEKIGYSEVRKTDTGFEKVFRADFKTPDELLVPIAESAADLLSYGDLAYLKKCENELCVLHFYDITKNHRRRWCSMAACGNRAKARAFYKRSKKEK